jgi:hypothetical protein
MPIAEDVGERDVFYNNISPLYVWLAFVIYNWFQTNIGVYGLLNTIYSIDYRILLVTMNFMGLYLFLRYARIDFTIRIRMNE